jgi:hypothetical protein
VPALDVLVVDAGGALGEALVDLRDVSVERPGVRSDGGAGRLAGAGDRDGVRVGAEREDAQLLDGREPALGDAHL